MPNPYFAQALKLLKRYYGYESFRPAQEEVIGSILDGHDTLAIMPTGAGKSLCFQLPAMIFPGVTLVISPLISLMKDQVDALKEQGMAATYINSSLPAEESQQRLAAIAAGQVKLVYVAPERLEAEYFQSLFSRVGIAMVAVDEAHCLSQWGHDFRPSYQRIAPFIAALPQRPLVTAFTATATTAVRDDIVRLLSLNRPNIYVSGFDRPNLYFSVLRGEDRSAFVTRYLKEHGAEAGIVYAATRKEVDNLYNDLKRKGFSVGRYHAGLPDEERAKTQDDFLYDNIQAVVATNAFGMGIDKSNVRYVIHYNMPKNIESYYQEAGRAGRDGEPGECILLYSPQDIRTQKYLIDVSVENEERKKHNFRSLQYMVDYCHTDGCLRGYIIHYFGGSGTPENCHNCSNCRGEHERVDMTVEAQKVFSCIYRMRQRYGLSLVAQVLKGSRDKRVVSLGFDKLSTYGLFQSRALEDIRLLIRRFVVADYLALTEGQYPVVVLCPPAYEVLRGQAKVYLNLPKRKAPAKAGNSALFERLRALRKKLAARDNVPPYIVFSDATLRDMCLARPADLNEMRRVKGVGEQKLLRYGQDFLACLQGGE